MQELIDDLPTKLKSHASWLINAGAEDTKHGLSKMTGNEDDMRMLRAAIATEKGKQGRPSRLKPMEAKLRKFSETARTELIAAKSGGPSTSKSAQSVEVVTEAEVTQADLRAAAQRVNQTIELIKGHQDAFEDATLEHRLCIGLEIVAAQEAFGMTRAEYSALGGRPALTVSRRDTVPEKPTAATANPLGFSNWIKNEIPDLKRPTAIKYASGFLALGIPRSEATPAKIKAKLKDLYHHADKAKLPRPSLASLVKQAPKLPKPENLTIIVPKSSKQLKLEDAREIFHRWKEDFDKAVKQGHLEHLDKKGLEDLQEFTATVRDRIKARLK